MTVNDLISSLGKYPVILLSFFCGLPLMVLLLRLLHGRYKAKFSPWKYFYSIVTYLSVIPGIFALFIVLYLAAFQKADLTQLNILTYLLPVLSMGFTLVLIRKFTTFENIPGFKKLKGLFLLTASVFIILLILDRLRIYLFFHGSIWLFIALFAGIFLLLRLGVFFVFGRSARASGRDRV